MSGTVTPDDPGPEATLAVEYVLGTLDLDEAEAARIRIQNDGAFAADVAAWENRLAPLALLVAPVAPPASLWTRIEDSTGETIRASAPPASPRHTNDNGLRLWRATALAGLAVAAGLVAFIALRPPGTRPVMAVLTPYDARVSVLVAMAGPNGTILLRPLAAIKVAADKDLELWQLAAGATKPVSLGVLPAAGKVVPPGVAPGTMLLVSLEPKGGSTTGQPTGPVLYAGKLAAFE